LSERRLPEELGREVANNSIPLGDEDRCAIGAWIGSNVRLIVVAATYLLDGPEPASVDVGTAAVGRDGVGAGPAQQNLLDPLTDFASLIEGE